MSDYYDPPISNLSEIAQILWAQGLYCDVEKLTRLTPDLYWISFTDGELWELETIGFDYCELRKIVRHESAA